MRKVNDIPTKFELNEDKLKKDYESILNKKSFSDFTFISGA